MAKSKWGMWENVSQIGEGGAGQVFQVRHTETGQVGALKKLKNAKRHERFKSEVEAVRKLDHPGIVRLLDASLDADPLFAVYEYEPGGNLGDVPVVELLGLPLPQRLRLCEEICDALHAAHLAGLVHRDVKPDNILISEDRKTARLCDFGLVYCADGERQTATMEQVGSRFFIPPELEEGRADEVSPASDVYSMGKVLYYVITGQMFSRERHRESKYDLAALLKNTHLEAISRILDRSIIAPVAQRFKSAAEMKSLIEAARAAIDQQLPIEGVPGTYRCLFCRVASYKAVCHSQQQGESHNQGYKEGNMTGEFMVFLECPNCGNCQRFKLKHRGEKWFPQQAKANSPY